MSVERADSVEESRRANRALGEDHEQELLDVPRKCDFLLSSSFIFM